MSDAKLNALERDVEQARARFADDLARLRSPSTLARFKDDAWAEARDTKDELVGKTKEAAKDGAQRLFTELQERAAANPVAALAIGAGFAGRRRGVCREPGRARAPGGGRAAGGRGRSRGGPRAPRGGRRAPGARPLPVWRPAVRCWGTSPPHHTPRRGRTAGGGSHNCAPLP